MNRIMFAALALTILAAAAPHHRAASAADRAGNRMLAFPAPAARRANDPFALHCTADRRWCARLRSGAAGGAWRLELSRSGEPARQLEIAAPEDAFTELEIWPHIVTEPGGGAIVGVWRSRDEAGPQGEGGNATLALVRARPGTAGLRQVLEVPTWAYVSVRDCLHRGDSRRRFGACEDKAEFTGTLTLDPATRAGPPHFLFAARARTWPAHGVLERELDRQVPLRRADIRWAVDPACTYRRRFGFDARTAGYVPDGPYPRCEDYFGH